MVISMEVTVRIRDQSIAPRGRHRRALPRNLAKLTPTHERSQFCGSARSLPLRMTLQRGGRVREVNFICPCLPLPLARCARARRLPPTHPVRTGAPSRLPPAACRTMCSTAPFACGSPGANARTVVFACASLAHDVLHRAVCLPLPLARCARPRRLPPAAFRMMCSTAPFASDAPVVERAHRRVCLPMPRGWCVVSSGGSPGHFARRRGTFADASGSARHDAAHHPGGSRGHSPRSP